MLRRLFIGTVAVAALGLVAGPASAATVVLPPQGKVGPHQVFGGLVNDQSGIGTPAPIHMACFGPVRPGEKGHPMAGQSVEVFRPEAIVGHFGYTGARGNHIVAFFGPPPPAPVAATASTVTFTKYLVKKPIPTSLELPCFGTGTVTFVPMPQGPLDTRDATVRVSYEGQP
ncbi:MAG TPA: hypothetical protein VK771_11320 [Acidimicrobiia bacterium]|jgi:hypothetical protein|nr:hypothetical protein [Acidimicrobiia bacterium]